MKPIEWHLGDIIAKYRVAKGYTRIKLARKVGLTPGWLGKIEKTGRCSDRVCREIARILGTTLEEMNANIPLRTDQLICRKHRDAFTKADRMLHDGGAFAGLLVVALEAAVFAHDRGFDASQVLKRELESGSIERINI